MIYFPIIGIVDGIYCGIIMFLSSGIIQFFANIFIKTHGICHCLAFRVSYY